MISRIFYMNYTCLSSTRKNLSVFRCLNSNAISSYQWNSKITSSFKSGDIETALYLFDEMPFKNVVTWNCMVSGYIRNGRIRDAREMFDKMPYRNIVSWTAMLNGYAKFGRIEEARNLFDAVSNKNVFCWNSMLSGYVKNGQMLEARKLFNAAPVKNSISWATIIEGYFSVRLVEEAEAAFDECPIKGVLVYNAMLTGYAEMGDLESLFRLFMGMSECDVASWTTVISCYSRIGEMEKARGLFEEMPEKDIVAWTVMIRGYLQNNQIEGARKLFNEMPQRDIVAWNSMIGGYVQDGIFGEALELFKKMPRRDMVSWNTILQGYIQQNDMVGARNFFEKMPNKDKTSWNTMISGYQSEEALALYTQMLQNGFKPDEVTFSSLISICGSLAIHGWGKAMHMFAIKYAYENDNTVVSSLISMYSKCGFLNDATLIFERMINKDTVAWNSMIVAQAYHGSAVEALRLFPYMTQSGLEPDHITFLGILTACAHSGLVEESWTYFKSMEECWHLIPKAEHYGCMIDILGRSGLLAEAYEFVKQLPENLPTHGWETLLSSCRVHDKFELGKLVAEKLFSIQALNAGMGVLQSNICAARGMWEDATNVRSLLRNRGVKKELASSWIEIKGQIFHFVSSDKSHSQMEDIHKELGSLSAMVEEFG